MQRVAPPFPVPAPRPPRHAAQVLASLPATNGMALWLADRLAPAAAAGAARPTGFAALDAELPGGGWPAAGLTELLLAAPGSGELRLLAPALAASAPAGTVGTVLWVAPPLTPYAPALQALGLAPGRQIIVTPGSLADAAWAAEQGLRSGACAAVLWWQGQAQPSAAAALATALRRLHAAAQEGACPLFALRPASARGQASPAPLRLALEPAAHGQLAVLACKRRGPAMAAPLLLRLPRAGGLSSARHASRPGPAAPVLWEPGDAVVRAAPERAAA